MTLRRKLLAGVLAVFVLAGAGLWWAYQSRDALLKAAIEKYGPEMTGVAVTVQSVSLDPFGGRASIRGLVVGNPKGFDAPHALRVGELRVAMDPASIAGRVVRVKEVVLQSPEITWEREGGRSNLDAIQENVKRYTARFSGGRDSKAAEPGRRFVIDHLHLRDGSAKLGTVITLPLPDLHLRDIGKKDDGASAGEVVGQTWESMTRSVGHLASRAGAAAREGARGLIEGARGLFK